MSLLLFFGGVTIVIIIGIAVVVTGVRHHYTQGQKNKNKGS